MCEPNFGKSSKTTISIYLDKGPNISYMRIKIIIIIIIIITTINLMILK
jgi:hypothetical protein